MGICVCVTGLSPAHTLDIFLCSTAGFCFFFFCFLCPLVTFKRCLNGNNKATKGISPLLGSICRIQLQHVASANAHQITTVAILPALYHAITHANDDRERSFGKNKLCHKTWHKKTHRLRTYKLSIPLAILINHPSEWLINTACTIKLMPSNLFGFFHAIPIQFVTIFLFFFCLTWLNLNRSVQIVSRMSSPLST